MIDPRALTATERAAVEMIHDHDLYGNTSGYYGRRPHRITRALAASLIGHGLVRLDTISAKGSKLVLTGAGVATYNVMVERRTQRRRA
ncbi:hypothetical protein EN817_17510 [Mesorhizobium sp. M3A.F.Ca.ET.174.01.1.1]|uniref:hypothetical protein n=1 Tax=unclassified Mesorhizobium TaxID=325217 RepID=UPI001093CDEF|nr:MULTISPECIES: hypothetical protein [unclassified Mesorhizobium]TGS86699.1 hypothetical protein EN818_15365 [Mesorhizobium sp. M3A.F.Ca.ET.175.01.1.1]TGT25147.1 hypothetical protein EN817_17510 [Mesorhizobium sp. M3A.F.Ca.ET.174.01.1.1]